MLVKTYSSAVYGVDAIIITVEVNVTEGLYTFLVGLADEALKECLPRVESAIKTNEYNMPRTKVIINLAPAGIRKSGASFDLPIALAILAASGQINNPESLQDYCILGELGLDGSIHPIKGALPIAIQAQKHNFKALILPAKNAREAAVVKGLTVLPFSQLRDLIDFFNGNADPPEPANADAELGFFFPGEFVPDKKSRPRSSSAGIPALPAQHRDLTHNTPGAPASDPNVTSPDFSSIAQSTSNSPNVASPEFSSIPRSTSNSSPIANPAAGKPQPRIISTPSDTFTPPESISDFDFSEVKGQDSIKRALEIAAAGGHNALLIGPPGVGKTMLAQRLPSILPPLTLQEALETTRIHSVAGKLMDNGAILCRRPFRSPHHTTSANALVGGNSIPQPGEISLAHNGVLFLDELPEFSRFALEVLRQPMEERKVTISRTSMSVDFPANFMLIASMNPCPCGYHGHPDKECVCPPGAVQKYYHKISGPLLDRIDLHIEVTPVSSDDLLNSTVNNESSAQIRDRVIAARAIQRIRYDSLGRPDIHCNAQIRSHLMRKVCAINPEGYHLLNSAMRTLHLSARAYDRILKVSRTIADLEASLTIEDHHIAEAIQYRNLDREAWMY